MTEESKKNTEEENLEEDEKFKVVIPEANRVEMPKAEFPEQPDYLKVFADFYISRFEAADLEIMESYDGNHNMIEINTYITNNDSFSRSNLIKHVLNIHAKRFEEILANIKDKTGADPESMKTYADWDQWYLDRRNEIQQSMS